MNTKPCLRSKFRASFFLSPHFPRVLNAKLLLAALLFRSARTGTLATQAIQNQRYITPTFALFDIWRFLLS